MKWLLSFFLYFTSLLVFFICISIYLMLICFVSPYKIQPIAHLLCRLILLSSGQWLVIEGDWPPIDRVRLYLSNHESILDAFIFGAALSGQVSAVAAEDYFSIPIWGTIMRRYGVIPISAKSMIRRWPVWSLRSKRSKLEPR
jgi:1-acyl-sn-glycerol-3-phosphate acyltransferase